jgi:UDP-N-acetylmuramoyl-L-alanyl-D-glutamate--2,6-diaminopimelate ligase
MKLRDLLHEDLLDGSGCSLDRQDKTVLGISSDSRSVSEREVFFAISGAVFDAKQVVSEVLARNVAAVVYEGDAPPNTTDEAPLIKVHDVREALAYAAHSFYEKPSYQSANIAVTGTSGKTSVSWFLSHALHILKRKTFLGGTLGYAVLAEMESPAAELTELGNTSIDPISVQRLLKEAVGNGADATVFEATSQGIVQNRMRYVAWNGAVFTNLSRDHLDLHDSMEEYEEAKARLFLNDLNSSPKEHVFAVINGDDPAGARLAFRVRRDCPRIKTVVFSKEQISADAIIKNVVTTQTGISLSVIVDDKEIVITSSSIGTHSAYNLSCAALVLHELGYRAEEISHALSEVPPVPGRLEYISGGKVPVYIDYAHKPDALLKILQFLKPLVSDGRLICVFGCGGDRDTGKRSIMGKIAAEYADVPVVTSDNPRTEDPEEIIKAILEGIPEDSRSNAVVEVDRRKAIEKAIAMATPGDVVLIAGKGHEPYQDIRGVKHPFHDGEVAKAYL